MEIYKILMVLGAMALIIIGIGFVVTHHIKDTGIRLFALAIFFICLLGGLPTSYALCVEVMEKGGLLYSLLLIIMLPITISGILCPFFLRNVKRGDSEGIKDYLNK